MVARMGSRTVRHVQPQWRRAVRERQPQRQRLERQLAVRRRAQLSSIQAALPLGVAVCFAICPFHPPIILPMAVIFSDIAMYCLSLSESLSHRTINIILIVSTLRIANLTQGSFSSGFKKLAVAVASIASTNKLSILNPSECL